MIVMYGRCLVRHKVFWRRFIAWLGTEIDGAPHDAEVSGRRPVRNSAGLLYWIVVRCRACGEERERVYSADDPLVVGMEVSKAEAR